MKRFCKTCGAEISEGTNVCSICGSVYGEHQANETTVLNNSPFENRSQNVSANSSGANQYSGENNSNPYHSLKNQYNNSPIQPNVNNFNNQLGNNTRNQSQYFTPPNQSNTYNWANNNSNTNQHNPYQYSNNYGYNSSPPKKKRGKTVAIIMGIVIGVVAIIAVIGIIIASVDSIIETQSENTTDSSYLDDAGSEEIVINYGTVSGTNYTNPSMGLSFDLPSSDWRFLSNQEIYESSIDNVSGARVYLDDTNHVCGTNASETLHFDSYAVNSISASLIYTFYSEPSDLVGEVDIDEYLVNSANADIAEDSPYYVTKDDIYSYTVADEEYRMCDSYLDINGVTFNCTFAVRMEGDYICGIVVMNCPEYDSNSTLQYLDMFY